MGARGLRSFQAAALSAALFALALGSQIQRRDGLGMDEVHTLLLARLIAAGEPLPFYLGGFSQYEGGSWLIGWPVALLLKLGFSGPAACSWGAGGLVVLSVFFWGLLVARISGPRNAVLVGPLIAGCSPLVVDYSMRAWGSLQEAVIALPLLALLWLGWRDRGRPAWGWPIAGLALSGALILSYCHFVAALAFVLLEVLDGWRDARLRRALLGVAAVSAISLAGFALWLFLATPYPLAALSIREGHSLLDVARRFLAPPLLAILRGWASSWFGELMPHPPSRRLAGAALCVLCIVAAARLWRRSADGPPLVVYAALYLLATGIGHSLVSDLAVYRYYLPLLTVCAVIIACVEPPLAVIALLLGLNFWLPGVPIRPVDGTTTLITLGGSGLERAWDDPHAKFQAFRRAALPDERGAFSFGYGYDLGRRYSHRRAGMAETLGPLDSVSRERVITQDPQFRLYHAATWLPDFGGDASESSGEPEYLLGLGMGLLADERLDPLEGELLEAADPRRRAGLMRGVGAALYLARTRSPPRDLRRWRSAVRDLLTERDYAAIGLGIGAVRVDRLLGPAGIGPQQLGLDPESAAGRALGEAVIKAPNERWQRLLLWAETEG